MRGPLLAFVLLLVGCSSSPAQVAPTPLPTREPNVVNVTALLDLSGSRSPSGQPQRNAMQLWLDQPQPGVKLKVTYVDLAGSEARLLVELHRAAVEGRTDAIVIGVPVALDDTLAQAIAVASIPVLFTTPVVEPASTAAARFAFALAPTPATLARALARDVIARGRLASMFLVGDETTASIVERNALVAELTRMGIVPPNAVTIGSDGATRVRVGAAFARSVVLTGASGSYADEVKAIPAGASAPLVYLSYLTETATLSELRDRGDVLMWPGSAAVASASTNAPGAAFVKAFGERYGAPSTLAASAYDALSLIDAAAKAAPSELDAARLRLRVETRTFAGVVTSYSFTPARHTGFSSADLVFLQWSAARSAPVLAPPAVPLPQ